MFIVAVSGNNNSDTDVFYCLCTWIRVIKTEIREKALVRCTGCRHGDVLCERDVVRLCLDFRSS